MSITQFFQSLDRVADAAPSIAQLIEDLPEPAPPRQRDNRGRFVRNNRISSQGGRARAAALSRRRRRAIARKGRRAMVLRHFGGDDHAQRRYWAQLGAYVYERMAGAYRPGSPLRPNAAHPGPIQDWRATYYTGDLLRGQWRDEDCYGGQPRHSATAPQFTCSRCGWSGPWWGSRCPECGA